MAFYDDGPIIACSSGTHEHSAIAVIRLSGFKDLEQFGPYFSLNIEQITPRKACLGRISHESEAIDEGILIYFPAPNSYNGENILEMYVHGNPNNVERIIRLFTDAGLCRRAHPGEFTYRAVLNKKISLSQAEGLDLLINAKSDVVFNQGLSILHGQLHHCYLQLRDSYLRLRSTTEVFFDFLEDVGEEKALQLWGHAFREFSEIITQLYKKSQRDWKAITSPTVLLVGQTNAGKSSLFNELLQERRSIVSPEAGTTRDYVSEYLTYKGVEFRLIDTAGIRGAANSIEKEGIDRAYDWLEKSFYRILVINPYQTNLDNFSKFHETSFDLCVVTHDDFENCREKFEKIKSALRFNYLKFISLKNKSGPIEPVWNGPIGPGDSGGPIEPVNAGPIGPTCVIEEILEGIFNKYETIAQDAPILVARQRDLIVNIYHDLIKVGSMWGIEEIAVIDLEIQRIGNKIEELVGILTPDDVLNSVFKDFCIGK